MTDAHSPQSGLSSLSPLRASLFDLIVASLFINVLGLALPMALLQVYDRILPNASVGTLHLLVIGVVSALALESILNFGRSYITGWVGARFEHKAGCVAFERLLMTGIDSFERDGSGAHLERLQSLAMVREFYAGQAILTMLDLPFALLFLGLVAMMGGWLVLVPVTMLILFVLVATLVGYRMRGALERRMTADDRRFNFLIEVLGGIHTVKGFAMEAQMVRRYERLQEASADGSYRVARHGASALGVSSFFAQATAVGVAMAGATVVMAGDMTTGGLAACSLLAGRAMSPIQRVLGTWTRFQSFLLARNRLNEVFFLAPEAARPDLPALETVEGALEMRGVQFRHGDADQPLIIRDATIAIAAGECVVISGGNGAGKSTLLSLMQGALRPTAGEVLIDGQPISAYTPQSVRGRIVCLPQKGELFKGTILQNLTMFRKGRDEAAIETAALLGLDEVVATMALGFDTPVGDGAQESLPRGIRQRIAIARALVDNPQVVLFDEANTAVDTVGDTYLRAWLERAKGRRTLVLVTSRPSLERMADRVFLLENGVLRPKPVAARTDSAVSSLPVPKREGEA